MNTERLQAQWQRDQRVIEALSALNYRYGELGGYLQKIARSVCQLLEVDLTVVTLCQDEQFEQVVASSDGQEDCELYTLHGSLTGTVVATGCSLVVEDVRLHPEYGAAPEGFLCYLGVPLRTPQGSTIGTICSFHMQPKQFSPEEVRTAELFAERAATAIDNYRLYQLQQQFNETLEAEIVKRTMELRSTQAKLIENERLAAIGEFAAMIVHEIRNPLTTVKMGLNYFHKLDLPDAAQARLELSQSEATRLENLLNEILLYSKPQVFQPVELDLNALLQELLPPLEETPEAQGRLLKYVPMPLNAMVLGDRDKLKQVFINLIRNAFEAIALGETVTCTVEPAPDTLSVRVLVHNYGEPIPADALPHITEPFFSKKSGGTGLGLAIVRRIVSAHGGILAIQSTPERGTTFSIELPLLT